MLKRRIKQYLKRKCSIFFLKNLFACFLFLLIPVVFTGCSLAKEEGVEKEQDCLIGGYITREPVLEKTYAEYEWVEVVNNLDHPYDLYFEDVEGFLFYFFESYLDGDSHFWCWGDSAQSMANIREEDGVRYLEVNVTGYYMPRIGEDVNSFYLNPIYQTSDDEIYMVPGQGISSGGGMDSEGTKLSLSLSESVTWKLHDDTKTEGTKIFVELEVVYEPMEIRFLQMNENHEVIKEEIFLPKEQPTFYYVEPETAYIHIETKQQLPNGETVLIRDLVEWEGETMELSEEEGEETPTTHYETYYEIGDGFLCKDHTVIVWNKE